MLPAPGTDTLSSSRPRKEAPQASGPLDPLVAAIADAVAARIGPAGRAKRLMTSDQAAEYLGVGTDTVKRLHALRQIPSVALLDRKLLFDIDDLDAVIMARKELR